MYKNQMWEAGSIPEPQELSSSLILDNWLSSDPIAVPTVLKSTLSKKSLSIMCTSLSEVQLQKEKQQRKNLLQKHWDSSQQFHTSYKGLRTVCTKEQQKAIACIITIDISNCFSTKSESILTNQHTLLIGSTSTKQWWRQIEEAMEIDQLTSKKVDKSSLSLATWPESSKALDGANFKAKEAVNRAGEIPCGTLIQIFEVLSPLSSKKI